MSSAIERLQARLAAKQRHLELLQDVAAKANLATTVDEALGFVLDRVCAFTGWPVGHVYALAPDGAELLPTALWHVGHPQRYVSFQTVTAATRFRAGEALPGRVLASRAPAWIVDVTRDDNFPGRRRSRTSGCGRRSVFPC